MKKKIILGLLLILVIMLSSGIYLFNKKTPKYLNENAEFVFEGKTLIKEFSNDPVNSNRKYLDKVIEVKGMLKSINVVNGGVNLELEGNLDLETVSCNIDSSVLKENIIELMGKKIAIKGRCGGYLEEEMLGMKNVSMVQCSIQ